jgi:hypothetical protein
LTFFRIATAFETLLLSREPPPLPRGGVHHELRG